ncbi:hypothetical protein F4780DRAFT_785921 [Xylariomycetidae sp. FL0641]|nr:hypothetical protein F4780DRAFT_785921 [Xylariomycetidae sp. FL0641]
MEDYDEYLRPRLYHHRLRGRERLERGRRFNHHSPRRESTPPDPRFCPLPGCLAPFKCAAHCLTCGWDRALDAAVEVAGHGAHVCDQWKKAWPLEKRWDPGNPQESRRPVLKCVESHHDGEYALGEPEILHLRQRAVTTIIIRGLEAKYPPECPKCIAGSG